MITIKNKYLWMVLIALLPLLPLHAQHRIARKAKAKAATEQKAKTLNQIFKVNDYWQKNHTPEATAFWNVAAYHTGNMEVCKWLMQELNSNKRLPAQRRKLLTDKLNAYLAYSLRWAEHNQWKGALSGSIKNTEKTNSMCSSVTGRSVSRPTSTYIICIRHSREAKARH